MFDVEQNCITVNKIKYLDLYYSKVEFALLIIKAWRLIMLICLFNLIFLDKLFDYDNHDLNTIKPNLMMNLKVDVVKIVCLLSLLLLESRFLSQFI